MSLLKTGIEGLDEILAGGFRNSSIVLIEGLPGTGKTILASELAMRASRDLNSKTLYASFEGNPEMFASNSAAFGWDSQNSNFTFVDLNADEILENVETSLIEMIKAERYERVVIDSLAGFRAHFEEHSPKAYRDFLRKTFRVLRSLGILTFLITETEPSRVLGETGAGPEHFLVDTVISLRKEEQRRSLLRTIEVSKSRGQHALQGRHSLAIRDRIGLEVYPRAYSRERVENSLSVSKERESFGITGMEDMFGGGIFKGSTTLTVGISGTGKTIMGMHFVNEALSRGENALIVSLDDSEAQFARNAAQAGFKFSEAIKEGRLTILHEIPLEIDLDRHFSQIDRLLKEKKVSRIVVDSLGTYQMLLPKESHEFLLALVTRFRNLGITSMLAYECPELLGLSQITGSLKVSALADNIVLLNYVEISTMLRRAITVPKARGSAPDRQTKEYVIKVGGITLLDETSVPQAERVPQLPLSCYYGVLARSPTRHSPIIDESVAAGKPMPKSKIPRPVKSVN